MKLKLLLATLLCTSISFGQLPSYVPTNGLIAYYSFSGNANDDTGNGFDGIVNGPALVDDRNTNPNSAYSFDGVNDYIQISTPLFGQTRSSYSINLWIYSDGGNASEFISDRAGSSCEYRYHMTLKANNTISHSQYVSSLPIQNESITISPISSGTWHMLTAISNIDNDSISLYYDGVLHDSDSSLVWMVANNLTNIGAREGCANPMGGWFMGDIDDIAFYNRPLNDCEIQDLYYSQLNSFIVDAGIDQTVCSGESVNLTASNSMNYSWNNSVLDGSPFTPNATSIYIVIADTAGCTSTDSLTVTENETTASAIYVTATDTYTSPSGIVYDSSGVYIDTILNAMQCDSIITLNLTVEYTGINELENTLVSVYPNPTSKILSISGLEKLNGIYGYKIASICGTVISEIKGQSKDVNISKLRSGIYFLNVIHEEGIETIRFIKQ